MPFTDFTCTTVDLYLLYTDNNYLNLMLNIPRLLVGAVKNEVATDI